MLERYRAIDYLPSAMIAAVATYATYRFVMYKMDERYLCGMDRIKWTISACSLVAVAVFLILMPVPR